jgi:CheY-like chemotaxis protein
MTTGIASQESHVVQFYESRPYLYRAIAEFFAEAMHRGEPMVMIARRDTFEAVAQFLAREHNLSPVDAASRILFAGAESALAGFMHGQLPDRARFEQTFSSLVAKVREYRADDMIWMYGEMVDVLCQEGNHVAAARLEELWNEMRAGQRITVLCGYAINRFDDDVNASEFGAICREHTHVIPAEGFTDAPDDRTRLERVARLQQRARALDRKLARDGASFAAPADTATPATIYVIDDDASVRRSLARLLATVDLNVQTFESAEAFLAEVDPTSGGCLIVDIQLVGMTGSDLHSRIVNARWPMPVIAMSGSQDVQIEADARRRGARAFLRKPFDAETLIDAIARALA